MCISIVVNIIRNSILALNKKGNQEASVKRGGNEVAGE
jgi:hypothetical protein